MLTAPLHTEHASLYDFSSMQRPFYSTKSNLSDLSLVYCKTWGNEFISHNNEMKWAYGVAQLHLLKHYRQ